MRKEKVYIRSKYYENEGERGYVDYYIFNKQCPNAVTFLSDVVESFKEASEYIIYLTSEASSHIRYIDMQRACNVYDELLKYIKDLSSMVECIRSDRGDVWYSYNNFENNIKRITEFIHRLEVAFKNIVVDDSYDSDKVEKALGKLLFEIEYAYTYIKSHSERV